MSRTVVLAIGAHPDDVELSFGGTLARWADAGARVHVVDLTAGERGSRGDVETRAREARRAGEILGIASRTGLGLPDLGLEGADAAQRRALVEAIRRHRPAVVLAPHPDEGHADHRAAAELARRACEEARLWRAPAEGERHEVDQLWHAWPAAGADQGGGAGGGGGWGGGFVVDVGPTFARKLEAVRAYASQLGDGDAAGPETRITADDFLARVEARARIAGAAVGARYGEGFLWRGALRLGRALAELVGSPAERVAIPGAAGDRGER